MLNEWNMEANLTLTENGAASFRTTGSDCLNLFATIGALRNAQEQDIIVRFIRAFAENRDLAMKMLFYCRDIRGGLGERRVFRIILRYMAEIETDSVRKNLHLISEYGRWDDLTVLFGTRCEKDAMDLIRTQLNRDLSALVAGKKDISLLAKWLPSVNTSSAAAVKNGRRIAKALNLSEAEYRRTLACLRAKIRILENNLREKDYTFDYSAQPSLAMLKYRNAFLRHDRKRYISYLERVACGMDTLHTGTLSPYDLVSRASRREADPENRMALDVSWNAMDSYASQGNVLCVIDGSRSMHLGVEPTPITTALSLGMYFAERNNGMFHNCFITFSTDPRLVEIKGQDLAEKIRYCESFNEAANTNIQKVFELILFIALKKSLPQEEMPEALYFISDMEFDKCTEDASLSNFEYAKKIYKDAGYTLPQIVFWNVSSRRGQQPVCMEEKGVILVSGNSPRIFDMLAGGHFDPMVFMKEVLLSERYAPVCA